MADGAKISRRNLLLGTAGGVVALGVGGVAWVATSQPKDMVAEIVRRALPGVTIDEAGMERFLYDFMREVRHEHADNPQAGAESTVKWHATRALQRVIGLGNLEKIDAFGPEIEEIRRFALTRFLMQSNFFYEEDPKAQPIVYEHLLQPRPCGNPWADVSPPA